MAYYNKWKYISKNSPLFFQVIPKHESPIPLTLYKYYSLADYSIDALTKNYIYVSHPEQLNDVYDASENLLIFDDEKINKIILNGFPFSDSQKTEILNNKRFLSKVNRELIYSRLGIFSMTITPDNTLMWAHYSKNRGFAIEFNYERLKETSSGKIHGPFPMNYVEKIVPIKLSKVGIHCAMLMQSNIKLKDWEYENEQRLLVECRDGEYSLPSYPFPDAKERKSYYSIDAIESIWLAKKFFDEDELKSADSELGVLYYELKSNIDFKSSVLTFLSENKIKTYYWCQETIEMLPLECKVEKICSCKYNLFIKKISKECVMF